MGEGYQAGTVPAGELLELLTDLRRQAQACRRQPVADLTMVRMLRAIDQATAAVAATG